MKEAVCFFAYLYICELVFILDERVYEVWTVCKSDMREWLESKFHRLGGCVQ